MKSKAFIAAPLLGTLIFLICLMIIVNHTRNESAIVAEVVSDAYHNKLVSIVEIYRSDLGSVFNTGLQKNIEYGLTSRCWANIAPLQGEIYYENSNVYSGGGHDIANGVFITEKEERKHLCKQHLSLLKDIVCAKTQNDDLYGIGKWASEIAQTTSFEGISLKPANKDAFLKLSEYTENGPNTLCQSLISEPEIDCSAFSEGNFLCCSEKNADGTCKPGTEIPCKDGIQFYVKVNIENPDIYPKFPRIIAEDKAGNKIRTGAIADSNYDALINYPYMKYLDAAFRFNKVMAYGENEQNDIGGGGDEGGKRGVLEGSCIGGAVCEKVPQSFSFKGGVNYGNAIDGNAITSDQAKDMYQEEFLDGPIKKACKDLLALGLKTNFTDSLGNSIPCLDDFGNPNEKVKTSFLSEVRAQSDCISGNPNLCAFLADGLVTKEIRFEDQDSTRQIRAGDKNSFCWSTYLNWFNMEN